MQIIYRVRLLYCPPPPRTQKKVLRWVPSVWVRVGHFRAGFENWFSSEVTIYERKSQIFKKFSDGSGLFEFEGGGNKVNEHGNFWKRQNFVIEEFNFDFFFVSFTSTVLKSEDWTFLIFPIPSGVYISRNLEIGFDANVLSLEKGWYPNFWFLEFLILG